jgi:hypothetical protein
MADEAELANIAIFLDFISDHRRPMGLLVLLGLHLFPYG